MILEANANGRCSAKSLSCVIESSDIDTINIILSVLNGREFNDAYCLLGKIMELLKVMCEKTVISNKKIEVTEKAGE